MLCKLFKDIAACLKRYICESFDTHYCTSLIKRDLSLSRSAQITFLGVGGRTIDKLSKFDLHLVRRLQPQIVILEIGSNDLSPPDARP